MAFDQSTRNFLQRTVTKCREILAGRWQAPTEGEFFRQLQEIYGISPDGVAAPMEVLAHLGDEDRETARVLRDTIDHYTAGLKASGKAEKEAQREAVMRVAREQAFTVLNRLAALRMAEERGIVLECVRKGTQSEGFQLFLQSAGNAYGSTSAAYRAYLQVLFDELARDLGVLFNRFDKSSLLFPRHEALEALLKELSGTGEANRNASYTPEQVASFWGEDETIGWIYQYYNDPAERKKMREESAAPRNSRELAVRNQFFTPRYVVEFLTENTLGRIWYEMTRGQTRLAVQCRYLVRRPTEIFLAEGETAPETPEQEGLCQAELLKQPVQIPHRPLKDPREIRLLDPACGSMHFGLYAFDIFEAIYKEAWDKGYCPALQEAYLSKEEFLKDVPRLIIENNLHGIDIDPRATQIAALSLWLRAQKAWQQQKVPAADRPRVRRSNIVCAEPMPGSPEMLEEFVATLKPDLLGELVKTVFDKMQLAGEAGSLLKIEEEIRTAIDTARKEWLKQQDDLLTRKDGSQEEFFDTAEQQVIDALRAYAEQADADSYQRRLFADDAARGFAFIDLCRKRYDAVVMNPPFGEASTHLKPYLDAQNAAWSGNILCSFWVAALAMLSKRGRCAAIFDRSVSIRSSYAEFRENVLIPHLSCMADTGWFVLDADVETTAHILTKEVATSQCVFIDILNKEPNDKENSLSICVHNLRKHYSDESVYVLPPTTLKRLPNSIIGYYFDDFLISAFAKFGSLEEFGLQAREGHTFSTDQHMRVFWELDHHQSISPSSEFCAVYNGSHYSLFYTPIRLVGTHGDDAKLIREHKSVYLRNRQYQFQMGVGYGKRGEIFDAHILPSEVCFTSEGQAIAGITKAQALAALAYLNSSFCQYALTKYCGQHKRSGYVNLLPYDRSFVDESLRDVALSIIELKRRWETLDQTSREFRSIIFPNGNAAIHKSSLSDLLERLSDAFANDSAELQRLLTENDRILCEAATTNSEEASVVLREFEANRPQDMLSDHDAAHGKELDHKTWISDILAFFVGTTFGRWDIRYATGKRQPPELPDPFDALPVCPPGMLKNAEGLPAEPRDVSADYPLRISWPGILVDDENHPEDIDARVREAIEVIWKDRAEAIEQEACGILGVKTLRDYFRRPAAFFADHLKRYSKSRRQAPIYWPLSTKSGSYTLWLYYHRLTPDTLYKCVQECVEPKIKDVEQTILRLRTMLTANEGGSKERKQLEEAETLLDELKEMHAELSLWAPKWKPNLNDGVLITACPLWKLFRLPRWQNALETCWKELERGDYDWAHLAYTLFPDRVREKCKADRSIAIAHELENLCQVQAPAPKAKRAKKQKQPSTEEALL